MAWLTFTLISLFAIGVFFFIHKTEERNARAHSAFVQNLLENPPPSLEAWIVLRTYYDAILAITVQDEPVLFVRLGPEKPKPVQLAEGDDVGRLSQQLKAAGISVNHRAGSAH